MLIRNIFIAVTGFVIILSNPNLGHAQINSNPKGSFDVQVGGTVSSQSASQQVTSNIPVTINGFASPNASIVLVDASGTSITTLTANAQGTFNITNINLPPGSADYCFKVVDFKRLGTSESCITINPSTLANITNIYLPPTIGVERAEISEGEDAVIYGYTMPNATVKLKLSTGEIVAITADETGYYEYRNNALKAGNYSFIASASYNATDSLDPRNSANLTKLSPEEVVKKTKEAISRIGKDEGGFPWWILFLFLLLALIGALFFLLKRNPKLLLLLAPFFHKFFPQKGLHHDRILKQINEESKV